ncbi:Anti-sigma F factor antagonist [Aquisphaera giovannonii]|uniref:Anti-sigma factor antagonist n=1 Tax=Aquisphaera giovannonii TaxID=406548 RepID=A0A5B9W8K4_9BACT|nr:STAS domain-containing protein [Aquisphaera giovannonii]QEH36341.1 Anti-sigma F factor antagonist [Aquisphaera giovannonii]
MSTTFTARDDGDALIIHFDSPAGLNDFRNSSLRDSLYAAVQERETPQVALDLEQIDYLSSSGVAILVGLKRRIDTRNGKLVLFRVQPVVSDLLKVMKLDRYFPITADEPSALAALRPVPTN